MKSLDISIATYYVYCIQPCEPSSELKASHSHNYIGEWKAIVVSGNAECNIECFPRWPSNPWWLTGSGCMYFKAAWLEWIQWLDMGVNSCKSSMLLHPLLISGLRPWICTDCRTWDSPVLLHLRRWGSSNSHQKHRRLYRRWAWSLPNVCMHGELSFFDVITCPYGGCFRIRRV